jgi:hypothetical protein
MRLLVRSVAATCLAALICAPVNYGFYRAWINFDPQGYDQYYPEARTTLLMAATSGAFWAMVIAFVLGLYSENLRRAVSGGAVVALTSAVAGWVAALRAHRGLERTVERFGDGEPAVPALLADRHYLWLAALLFVATVLMAVAGRRVGWVSHRVAVTSGVALIVMMCALALAVRPTLHAERFYWWVFAGLLPPAGVAPLVVRVAHDDGALPYAVAVLAGSVLWAVVVPVLVRVRS